MKDEEIKLEEIEVSHTLGGTVVEGVFVFFKKILWREKTRSKENTYNDPRRYYFQGICKIEISTFENFQNLFWRVIRKLVHMVVRFCVFFVLLGNLSRSSEKMGKRCTRVKLVMCAFSRCTVLVMSISRLTEWENLQNSSIHTFALCVLTISCTFSVYPSSTVPF